MPDTPLTNPIPQATNYVGTCGRCHWTGPVRGQDGTANDAPRPQPACPACGETARFVTDEA